MPDRHAAVGMVSLRMAYRVAASRTNCSHFTIIPFTKLQQETGSVSDLSHPGRQTAMSCQQDRHSCLYTPSGLFQTGDTEFSFH